MGLDISVYEKVTFVRTRATDDNYWGEGDYWGDGEDLEALSNEEDFRERSDGLADGLYKTSGRETTSARGPTADTTSGGVNSRNSSGSARDGFGQLRLTMSAHARRRSMN